MDGTPSALIPTVLREGNECWCMQVRTQLLFLLLIGRV